MAAFNNLPSEVTLFLKEHRASFITMQRVLEEADTIVIFRHLKPDFDAMGSQMGLYQFLKDNFPEKEIHFVGDNHPSFTPRLFPETERLPESYFASKDFVAVVLDVGDKDRIANPHFTKARTVLKIDHHPCKKEIASKRHTILDLDKAAAAEILAAFLLSWKGKVVSKETARWLYIGIVGDSGRFMFSSTSVHTFQIAEMLLQTGFDLRATYLAMYEKTVDSLISLSYVLNAFKVS